MTASLHPGQAPYVSTRTCRPCGGTGVGESFGTDCPACAGTGDAPPSAPPRLRRTVVPENRAPRPTEAQLDQLGLLIDACHPSHPEVHTASDMIGRTDLTEAQAAGLIAALSDLVPPQRVRGRAANTRLLVQPRPQRTTRPVERAGLGHGYIRTNQGSDGTRNVTPFVYGTRSQRLWRRLRRTPSLV